MKFLQATEKLMSNLGLNQPDISQKYLLNWRNMLVLFPVGQFSIFAAVYFLIDARSLIEYSESFYISITALLFSTMFSVFIWNTTKLFDLICGFECVTRKRES